MAQRDSRRARTAASFKAYMLKNSTKTDANLYDHLCRVLMNVLDERPHDVTDILEDISLAVKQEVFEGTKSTLQNSAQITAAELQAEKQSSLFSHPEKAEDEEPVESPLPNVSEISFFLEQAAVGLGREEMQRIFLALKQLVEQQGLTRCRLWGKVLGIQSSYIIAEADHGEDEEDDQASIGNTTEEEETQAVPQNKEDPLPQSVYKRPPTVPQEPQGTGVNKFSYYVCNELGDPWVKLPSATPAQITVARQIHKFFTGQLDSPIVSYPPFPGNEANYLRAQIARISAGTQVSPQGFYQIVEEEDDEDEEAPRDSYEVNLDFEGVPVAEMADSLSAWVHHGQHILKQGRCTWVNLAEKSDEDSSDEEDGDEKEEEQEDPEPEVGPPLLTPLSQDAEMFNSPPWTSRLSSTLNSHHAIAVLRSNLWPGAFAYACGKKFDNIYVGWGLKYTGECYNPPALPLPQEEYTSGPEITEALDPSLEDEQALKDALEEQEAIKEEAESDEEDEEDD